MKKTNKKNVHRKRRAKWPRIIIMVLLVVLGITCIWMGVKGVQQVVYYVDGSAKTADTETETETEKGESSFTFVGVGDNLIHGAFWYYAMYPSLGYDYTSVYETTNKYTQAADLAYINAETLTMAETESEMSHYPVFNGPIQILDAVNSAGFDWLALSSNHSMDMGEDVLIEEIEYIEETFPDMSVTGSNTSEEMRNTPVVREVNGIQVGLLGYTYGTNGIALPEDAPWLIQIYRNDGGTVDYDTMKEDLDRLKEVSDVQIVSMHWGDEYVTEPTDEEREIAQFLNEQGVEVIIGSHPHVVQTAEIIHGDDQDTLVYYSLGNFLSAQDENDNMVGGMASFTLNYDFDTGKTTFSDVKFIPTITWYDASHYQFQTYAMPDWTDDLAASHYVTQVNGEDITKQWVADYFSSIVGTPEGIEVVLD